MPRDVGAERAQKKKSIKDKKSISFIRNNKSKLNIVEESSRIIIGNYRKPYFSETPQVFEEKLIM